MASVGGGQTVSLLLWLGQNSRILSNKYCLLSRESPGGRISGGNTVGSGLHKVCCLFIMAIVSVLPSVSFLTWTFPGYSEEKTR